MPSPFPGMNPYIEKPDLWRDFHHRYLVYAAEEITRQVLPDYFVRIEEHVFLTDDEPTNGGPGFHADLTAAAEDHPPATGPDVASTVAALSAPAVVRLPGDYERNRLLYLEVVDRTDRRVVTVVELLSPANKKAGRDRRQFEAKRRALLASQANYIEIDLLRGGSRMPWAGAPACDYCVAISRPEDRPDCGFWPLRVRDPLPDIPIPLLPDAPQPTLALQQVLHRVYDAAGYAR